MVAEQIRAGVPPSQWPAEWFSGSNRTSGARTCCSGRPPLTRASPARRAGARCRSTLAELAASGLRGRGGAGFDDRAQMDNCAAPRRARRRTRVVVCNADEGEPGTFKDRVLLRRHADTRVRGHDRGGAGARRAQGFVYLRGEYRFAAGPLQAVLRAPRAAGLLGAASLAARASTSTSPSTWAPGPMCAARNRALIESLEGKRGTPRIRPPFPVESRLPGQPTVVNNVETFCAAAAHIALHGGAWWAAIGTPGSTGTKIHSVSGDCARPGLYEYPFGTRGRPHPAEDCGARDTQAVQVGGPSGVCLSAFEFGRRIAFEDVPTPAPSWCSTARATCSRWRGASRTSSPTRAAASARRAAWAPSWCGGAWTSSPRAGSRHDIDVLFELDRCCTAPRTAAWAPPPATRCATPWRKFRPAYEQRLKSLHFVPAFDLDAELSPARASDRPRRCRRAPGAAGVSGQLLRSTARPCPSSPARP
jgi:[NiFe] hydrogenase diaphorase moiety large subunit